MLSRPCSIHLKPSFEFATGGLSPDYPPRWAQTPHHWTSNSWLHAWHFSSLWGTQCCSGCWGCQDSGTPRMVSSSNTCPEPPFEDPASFFTLPQKVSRTGSNELILDQLMKQGRCENFSPRLFGRSYGLCGRGKLSWRHLGRASWALQIVPLSLTCQDRVFHRQNHY
jgi:hypothetical protein